MNEAAGKLARIDGQQSPDVVGQELLETVNV